MKEIFRKAITVLGSVALVGATVGVASAANYPAPFDDGSVVVTGAGAASSDSIAAGKVVTGLQSAASAKSIGKKTLSGTGDSYKFEKSSTKFHLGDTITGVISSKLDDQELPTLLADVTYLDTNNDEFDYTQEITMAANQLTMFDDNDYKRDAPTVGFKIASGATVMTYTLDFSDMPTIANMDDTDLTIMGKEYYVLSVATTNDKITFLDSANEVILSEGDTKTVTSGDRTYEVSIDYISSTKVSLKINGEVTKTLAEGGTYKLNSGSYVGIKELRYNAKDTGISSVKFSIGNGKLILTDGSDMEINDDTINNMAVTITNSSNKLDKVSIAWKADDDLFVTESSEITMPGFEAVKLSFGGLAYPAEETIEVIAGSDDYMQLNNFPLRNSEEDISLLYTAGGSAYAGLGQDANTKLVTSATGSLTFDSDTDEYFVVSYDDGSSAESYLVKATGFKIDNSVNKTTFQYKNNGVWTDVKSDAQENDTFSLGDTELAVGAIDKAAHTVVVTNNSANTNFYTLYSKEGMKLFLPHTTSGTTGYINFSASPTAWNLTFIEEDKNENPAGGDTFYATVGVNAQTPVEPSITTISGEEATFSEIGSTDEFRSFMYSALASELLWNKGPDQKSLKVIYHGSEVKADVYVTAPSVGLTGSGETGIMSAKDSETSKYSGKNMVVIGGSAINTVAADLLGGAHRGAAFTTKTGVAAGGFLIESFDKGGKTALLVAGYNAADTSKAVDYLVNNMDKVDTTVGNKYTGTSATEAKLVVS